MFEVAIKSHFSAAHHLKGYIGSCASFHGHNWEVEVFVRGSELDATGILVDFRKLKQDVAAVVHELDHRDLNELEAFQSVNPTSENIARHLYRQLSLHLNNATHHVSRVAVHETPGTVASYWE